MSEPTPASDSHATTSSLVLRGGAWNTLALVLPQIYTVLISVAVARALGPDDMGRQSFISFVQLSLFLLFANGMPGALMRFTGEMIGRGRPDAVRRMLTWTVRTQVASAAVALLVIAIVGVVRVELRNAWILAGIACAAAVLHSVPGSLLMGLQRFRDASVIGLATGALGVVGTVGVLAAGHGIVGLFALEAAVAVGNAVLTAALARRAMSDLPPALPRELPSGLGRSVVRYAAVQTAQTVIHLVVWRRSEFFFLERWASDSELAMYSVAFAATTALVRFPQGISGVFLPAVATLHGAEEHERIRRAFERSVRLILVLTLPLTASALTLGPAAVAVVYGREYERAGFVLVVLLTVFPLLPLFNICSAVLQGVDRLGLVVWANVAATIVNLVADVTLIGRYGATGAALANVAAQGVAGILVIVMTVKVLRVTPPWRPAPNLAAASIAGLVTFTLSRLLGPLATLIVGGPAFVAVWWIAAACVRVVTADDANWLSESVGGRLGPIVDRLISPLRR